jgi:predicted DNA binding protein
VPRATLRVKSNEGVVALSNNHPDATFEVLGGWPSDDRMRLLVRTGDVERAAVETTLEALDAVAAHEVRHAGDDAVLFEMATPMPPPHGAMADSGVVPSFPLRAEDGWLVGDLVASRDQIRAFREELEDADIPHELEAVRATAEPDDVLTDRQREVLRAAHRRGYYDEPRGCTQTALADELGVDTSVVSRVLKRAEGALVAAYLDEADGTDVDGC